MAAPQFIVGADGFDRYPAGTLSPLWPWQQINANNNLAIVAAQSLFGSNALGVPTASTNSCGWVYQVPSAVPFLRKTGTGAFGWCGYIRLSNITTPGTDTMLAMSSSANVGAAFPILGQSYSTAYGLNLAFPSQAAGLASSNKPYLYAVKPNTWYWVGIYFSFKPTGTLTATYCINGKPIWQDVAVSWLSDILAVGQTLNALKVYNGVLAEWYTDDMVLHAVASSDPQWPAPATLTPEVLPQFPPRQITLAQAVATASSDGFVSMTSEPDYQAATDLTGVNAVAFLETTSVTAGSELYNWTAQAHPNINAVIYRGQASKPAQVSALQSVDAQSTTLLDTSSQAVGTGGFVGVSENDGTDYWTQDSIAAASFGQTAST